MMYKIRNSLNQIAAFEYTDPEMSSFLGDFISNVETLLEEPCEDNEPLSEANSLRIETLTFLNVLEAIIKDEENLKAMSSERVHSILSVAIPLCACQKPPCRVVNHINTFVDSLAARLS